MVRLHLFRQNENTTILGIVLRLLTCFLFALSLAQAQDLVGRASVVDRDTLEIGGKRFRLYEVDAPESGQVCKRPAELIGQRTVACVQTDTNYYGRVGAVCLLDALVLNQ